MIAELSERRIDARLILSIIAAGIMSFSGIVVETAMNVTFPTLMHEFNISTNLVQWITTGYLLVLALIIPASSYLKKNFTNKTLFITAILFFIGGTILAACTPVFSLLLFSRLLQGIGTGIALPLMFNIILEQVPAKQLGFMIGLASLITAMAPAVGPSLGGLIVSLFGWRMIFVALLPFLLFSLLAGSFSIRQVTKIVKTPFYWFDYSLMAVSFISFILAISLPAQHGWLSFPVLFLLAVSLITLVVFCRQSLKNAEPLLHVNVLSNKAFTCSLLSILSLQFICLALGFLLPNYAQLVRNEAAFYAGIILLPGCILGALLAPVSGKILDRFGPRRPIITGNILMLLSCLCLYHYYAQISSFTTAMFYILFAVGQSSSVGNLMAYGLQQLPSQVKADGNAVINTLQQLAGAAGTAVITSIVASAQLAAPQNLPAATQYGSGQGFFLLTILAILMLCSTLLALHKHK